jgi:hypothetical protein
MNDPQQDIGNTAGLAPAKPTPAKPPAETDEHRYARQTRDATVFIAWIVGIGVAIMLVLGIIAGVELAHLNSSSNGGGGVSNCYTDGGTDLTC